MEVGYTDLGIKSRGDGSGGQWNEKIKGKWWAERILWWGYLSFLV